MKRPKHLLLIIVAMISALVLLFAACSCNSCSCNSCNDDEPEPTPKVLTGITLTTTDVKTSYVIGDAFNASGLKVTAAFDNEETDDTLTPDSEGVKVDSSAFVKGQIGEYQIKVSYTYEEVTKEASYKVTVSDAVLTLDYTGVQQRFIVNQDEFNHDGLKVMLTVTGPTGSTVTEVKAEDYVVQSKEYDNTVTGDYNILVAASYGSKQLFASYTVRVIEPRQGLDVKLKEGKTDTITLAKGESTTPVTADLSDFATWVEVRKPDKYGVVDPASDPIDLTAEGVTVGLYDGKVPVAAADAATLQGGVYTIRVDVDGKDNADQDFVYTGFVNVFVIDNIKSFTWLETASGTKTNQLAGKDKISRTWQYELEYESGKTESVNCYNEHLTVEGLDTKTATEEGTEAEATVTYSVINVKGQKIEKSATVKYTIYDGGAIPADPVKFSADDVTQQSPLTADVDWKNIGGETAGVTILTGSKVTDNSKTFTIGGEQVTVGTRVQTAGQVTTTAKAIKIELAKAAKITVYFCHTGTGSGRFLRLIDGEENEVYKSEEARATSATSLEIQVSAGGTYYLGGGNGGINVYYLVIE